MKITRRQLRRIIKEVAGDDGGQALLAKALEDSGDVPLEGVADLLNGLGYHAQLQSYYDAEWVSVSSGPGMFHPIEVSYVTDDTHHTEIIIGKLAVSSPTDEDE